MSGAVKVACEYNVKLKTNVCDQLSFWTNVFAHVKSRRNIESDPWNENVLLVDFVLINFRRKFLFKNLKNRRRTQTEVNSTERAHRLSITETFFGAFAVKGNRKKCFMETFDIFRFLIGMQQQIAMWGTQWIVHKIYYDWIRIADDLQLGWVWFNGITNRKVLMCAFHKHWMGEFMRTNCFSSCLNGQVIALKYNMELIQTFVVFFCFPMVNKNSSFYQERYDKIKIKTDEFLMRFAGTSCGLLKAHPTDNIW